MQINMCDGAKSFLLCLEVFPLPLLRRVCHNSMWLTVVWKKFQDLKLVYCSWAYKYILIHWFLWALSIVIITRECGYGAFYHSLWTFRSFPFWTRKVDHEYLRVKKEGTPSKMLFLGGLQVPVWCMIHRLSDGCLRTWWLLLLYACCVVRRVRWPLETMISPLHNCVCFM